MSDHDAHSLLDAMRYRSRSVLAYVDGEPVYLLEVAADRLEQALADQEALADAAPIGALEHVRRVEAAMLRWVAERIPFVPADGRVAWLRNEADRREAEGL